MKILHLTGDRQDAGGILSVIRSLDRVNRKAGFKNIVWVHRDFVEQRKPSLDYRRSPFVLNDGPSHLRLVAGALAALPGFRNLLRNEHFDLIHAHSRGGLLVALFASWMLKRNIVFTNHTFANRTGFYRSISRCSRVHSVVLNPRMARHYGLSPETARVAVISACFDDSFLKEPLAETDRKTLGDPIQLVGLGSIVRWKNWHLILEAFTQLKKIERIGIRFDHWGPIAQDRDSMDYSRELDMQIAESGIKDQVCFHGPADSVKSCLTSADAFILPSRDEPCSVALMEALAMGIPAIVSNGGGNPDLVQDKQTGMLFQRDDVTSLTQIIRTWKETSPQLSNPSSIRDSVRHRSAERVAEEYRRLYKDVV